MSNDEIKNIIGWSAFIMLAILFVQFNVYRVQNAHLSDDQILVNKSNYIIMFFVLPVIGFWGTKNKEE